MEELWFKFKFHLVRLAYFKKRNRIKRYGFTLLITALVFPLFIFLPSVYFDLINSQTVTFLVFILVVTASSWYGGLGPGILATILTSFINYLTFLKVDISYHSIVGDLLITFIYIIVGFLISLISEARYEAELQKDEFIALAAHEIKTPITVIKGYINLFRQKVKKNENKIFGYIDEIDIQTSKILELIGDLMDVTKIEIGKFVYRDELFDFDRLVKELVMHQQINSKRITLTGVSRKIVKGDRYRIGQVVSNLLSNAIKYSPQKSPIKIRVKVKRDGVILAVKDYGIGIPRLEQKAIFNNFYRARRTRREKAEGLGLGLFISSQIVKYYRGKLYVKSNGKRGSVFYLELPKNC